MDNEDTRVPTVHIESGGPIIDDTQLEHWGDPMANIDPIHPGEHLAEFLDELGISQYRLAKVIGTPPRRINEIVHGRRSITADTAVRLGQALGITPEFWLNLQNLYDLDLARASIDIGSIESLARQFRGRRSGS